MEAFVSEEGGAHEKEAARSPAMKRIKNWENPATILLQFREGKAKDMPTLFHALGIPYELIRRSTRYLSIPRIVQELTDAGLLRIDDKKISVTDLLPKIQTALDFSLKSLAAVDPARSMTVEPLFGLPGTLAESLDVFVLTPFKADMLPVYEDHIKPTCASMELTVRRADDFFTADSVVQDVWKAIAGARLIVADCTDRNPNVFYEIGLAHAIGKPTILLTQRAEDIPFDLRHLRYIEYQLIPRGMKEFETKFKQTVQTVLSAE